MLPVALGGASLSSLSLAGWRIARWGAMGVRNLQENLGILPFEFRGLLFGNFEAGVMTNAELVPAGWIGEQADMAVQGCRQPVSQVARL
jgi:hypothetical protein